MYIIVHCIFGHFVVNFLSLHQVVECTPMLWGIWAESRGPCWWPVPVSSTPTRLPQSLYSNSSLSFRDGTCVLYIQRCTCMYMYMYVYINVQCTCTCMLCSKCGFAPSADFAAQTLDPPFAQLIRHCIHCTCTCSSICYMVHTFTRLPHACACIYTCTCTYIMQV